MNKVMIVGLLAILAGCGSQVVDFAVPVGSAPVVVVEDGGTVDADTADVVDAGTDSSTTYVEEWDSGNGGGRCVCTCTNQ